MQVLRALAVVLLCSLCVASCTTDLQEQQVPSTDRGGIDAGAPDAEADGGTADCGPEDCPDCLRDQDCEGKVDGLRECQAAVCVDGQCEAGDAPVDSPCDDGDPCSSEERCTVRTAGRLECVPRVPSCDDGDVCNGAELCTEAGCEAGEPAACDDGDVCNGVESCDPATGCAAGEALACDDGDPCTDDSCDATAGCLHDEVLDSGCCVSAADCDDGVACTTDACGDDDRCTNTPDDTACDDADVCNGAEVCDPGAGCATGAALDCDDGNACTDDSCDAADGCGHVPSTEPGCCTTDDDCSDGNPCTADACGDGGACASEPRAGSCEDGDLCTVGDTCAAGACVGGGATDCDDGSVCTTDDCVPAFGCTHTPDASACDDGNPCTNDACNDTLGCLHANAAAPCDDGNPCTIDDACQGGACAAGVPKDCGDGNDCTNDTCDEIDGSCSSVARAGSCEDGDACTTDEICAGGRCVAGVTRECDDLNPCTDDDCETDGGCRFSLNTAPCEDGDACTVDDACEAGNCVGGPARDCDDDEDCTADSCDATEGCQHAPVAGDCNDGDACTSGDTCADGACQGGPALDCDDGEQCTANLCDPLRGCSNPSRTGACEDGDPCTSGDSCSAGSCRPGGATDCDDGNPCTADDCQQPGGCRQLPLFDGFPCPDGDACNGSEACLDEVCEAGTPLTCEDDELCTTDQCSPARGCVFEPNSLPCNDGEICTTDDTCADGRCAGGPPPSCDDGNPCTDDACVPGVGCRSVAAANSCDDGDPCTEADTCDAGRCGGEPIAGCTELCRIGGETGDGALCPLDLARLGESNTPAARVQFRLRWSPDAARLVELVDTFCSPAGCQTRQIPTTHSSLLPSGHQVIFEPASPGLWAGDVRVDVSHVGNPHRTINDAWIDAGSVTMGDARLASTRWELLAAGEGVRIGLIGELATGPDDATLAVGARGGQLVTTDTPCGGAVCFDANPCTTDTCAGGACAFPVRSGACDDGNPCTAAGACNGLGQCVPGPDEAAGFACAGEDRCTDLGACDGAGACVIDPDLAVTCPEPEDPCLRAFCDPATGSCGAQPDPGAPCDDGNACTVGDACDLQGRCRGAPRVCEDGIGCTGNRCDPTSGCVFVPDDGACAREDNPCVSASCDPSQGCVEEPVDGPCDDGDICTANDHCDVGRCTGTLDPLCRCDTTDDCAPVEDGDACNGTYTCIDEVCRLTAESVVRCPVDGAECKEDWFCDPATGLCDGTPMTCDDGVECTDDTCDPTRGCVNRRTDTCDAEPLCEVVGEAGALVECTLAVARRAATDRLPVGATVHLRWDPSVVRLDNLVDEFCFGSFCGDFDMVSCRGGGDTGCSFSAMEPSGHQIIGVPRDRADWHDRLTLSLFHPGSAGEPLTDAVRAADGSVGGEAALFRLRFRLERSVPADDAASVLIINTSRLRTKFDPPSGQSFLFEVVGAGNARAFIVRNP